MPGCFEWIVAFHRLCGISFCIATISSPVSVLTNITYDGEAGYLSSMGLRVWLAELTRRQSLSLSQWSHVVIIAG
jgi:hypothetical protein